MRIGGAAFVPFLSAFLACSSAVEPAPDSWLPVPVAPEVTRAQLERVVAETSPVARPPQQAPENGIRIVRDEAGAGLFRGELPLTPAFEDIESFDVSEERGEAVFSARRDAGYDIGLVAVEGSDVSWVPEDPADEVAPQWAPRGHKVSYVIRHRAGDFVRTVHIPTAVQLLVDFPFGVVGDLAWDRPAERFAVSWETVDASQRVELMRYGGEERRIVIPPAVQLDVSVSPFAGGLLMQPSSLSYGERLPVVIWVVAAGRLHAWDDARAVLLQETRSVALVVDKLPGDAEMAAVRESPWADPGAVFVVSPRGGGPIAGVTTIAGDPSLAGARHRRAGNLISVDPAVVESFAARFIAGQLKGTSPSVHR